MSEGASILASSRRKHYGTVEQSSSTRPKPHKLYHISPGDTLVSIAVKYDTTVQHLKQLNHLWTTDISNLECIKVPIESTKDDSSNQLIELSTVVNKHEPKTAEQIEITSRQSRDSVSGEVPVDLNPSAYLKMLFDHAQQAKQCASSVLQNSKLTEILSDTGSLWSVPSHLHHTSQQPSVMVTTPSAKFAWVDPKAQRPHTYITPSNWHDSYHL